MTDITLEQRLRDVLREMDAHCDKLDAIGGGHAAQPIRDFAERIEAALRLSAGADLVLVNRRELLATLDGVVHSSVYAAVATMLAAAHRHETGEGS